MALLPGSLSPRLREQAARLGTWVPFGKAAELLQAFTGVSITEATVRRHTEQAGAAAKALDRRELEQIEGELPPAPAGPEKLVVSVDGAMVRTVEEGWLEVKMLAIGGVEAPVQEQGKWVVHCRDLSYFSRLENSEVFEREALVEVHRRGVERAKRVAAVVDGAAWCQGFIDLHCPEAQRILDFGHAGSRVGAVAQLLFGEGSSLGLEWVRERLHTLKERGPEPLLEELRQRCTLLTPLVVPQEAAGLAAHLAYLEKRADQMQYPLYRQQGWPIGSGMVESANKLVVEARLKGAGMQWAKGNVNSMLGLRNLVCSNRWAQTWPAIEARLREERTEKRRVRRRRRRCQQEPQATAPSALANVSPPDSEPTPPTTTGASLARPASRPHPWRRFNPNWLVPHRAQYAKS